LATFHNQKGPDKRRGILIWSFIVETGDILTYRISYK